MSRCVSPLYFSILVLSLKKCYRIAVDLYIEAFAPPSPPQSCMTPDGTSVEESAEKLYECSFCCVSFAQPQGLTRHSRDIHSPKRGCEFCVKFTWSLGRTYIYRRHLQEEHPGFVSESVSATPIRRRRGVKLKDRHCRGIARRNS